MERRFRAGDWLTAIGGIVFLFAALLPWWRLRWDGPEISFDAFDYQLTGLVPLLVFLWISVATVIIKTDSLPLPDALVHPRVLLPLAGVATALVGVRAVWDGNGGGSVSRGLGLYLATAAALMTLAGCIVNARDEAALDDDLADDEDDEDDGHDRGGTGATRRADAADDDLVGRFNTLEPTGEGAPIRPRDVRRPRPAEAGPAPAQQQPAPARRRAARAMRAPRSDGNGGEVARSPRRHAGPPRP